MSLLLKQDLTEGFQIKSWSTENKCDKFSYSFRLHALNSEILNDYQANAKYWTIVDQMTVDYVRELALMLGLEIASDADLRDEALAIQDHALAMLQERYGISIPSYD